MQNTYITGLLVGLFASVFWGFTAIFFKQLDAFLPIEIAAHRILWTVVCLTIFGVLTARTARLMVALKDWHELRLIILSAVMMASNWCIFIYSIASGQLIEAGLGYFIYPLMVVAVGVIFLGERFSALEWLAIGLAALGVLIKTYANGGVPLIALTVSVTFTIYTLLGKTRTTGPVVGIWAECIVLAPVALGYLAYLYILGSGRFILGGGMDTMLAMATGPITALPLILYITASRAIGMATAGLMFYITPILHVMVAAYIFGEPFSSLDGAAFGTIWAGLVLLTYRQIKSARSTS